mmetsp:Transcript_49045/g.81485  ORF Transcript_49045/g.81485 Transcript_49045/m.81485 type:complete len:294 (-) Transcript_49045:620-1501(-)
MLEMIALGSNTISVSPSVTSAVVVRIIIVRQQGIIIHRIPGRYTRSCIYLHSSTLRQLQNVGLMWNHKSKLHVLLEFRQTLPFHVQLLFDLLHWRIQIIRRQVKGWLNVRDDHIHSGCWLHCLSRARYLRNLDQFIHNQFRRQMPVQHIFWFRIRVAALNKDRMQRTVSDEIRNFPPQMRQWLESLQSVATLVSGYTAVPFFHKLRPLYSLPIGLRHCLLPFLFVIAFKNRSKQLCRFPVTGTFLLGVNNAISQSALLGVIGSSITHKQNTGALSALTHQKRRRPRRIQRLVM